MPDDMKENIKAIRAVVDRAARNPRHARPRPPNRIGRFNPDSPTHAPQPELPLASRQPLPGRARHTARWRRYSTTRISEKGAHTRSHLAPLAAQGAAPSARLLQVTPFARRGVEGVTRRKTMRILIVEDEAKTGTYLRKGLTEAGFIVDWVEDGVTGQHLALTEDYDLIILDVMLPGQDGWTVLKNLRHERSTSVLLLTARDDLDDKVRGLEMGGDDYLIKPFDFAELLARVRSILRRGHVRDAASLHVSDLALDLTRRKATRQGDTILLTAKEFALLWLLMRRHGEILSRSTIASQVWDMNFDSDTNVVDAAIRRVRAKVDDNYEPKLIHTVRGMGYVLEERCSTAR
jgi:two-component system copper resistance phosphate regulon response regulator CusR